MRIRTYSELHHIETYEERFDYLQLKGQVGESTFGFERYINQRFYTSREWKQVREFVIARDEACDMAFPGYEIHDRIVIHHMNPMGADDIVHDNSDILNPEFLISVTHNTHNAIHYGSKDRLVKPYTARRPGDTSLWSRERR